eukprot:236068_1
MDNNACSKKQELCSRCSSFFQPSLYPVTFITTPPPTTITLLFLPARTYLQGVPHPFRSHPGLHPDEQLYPDAAFAGFRCHPPSLETSCRSHQKDSVARSRAKPSSRSYPIQGAHLSV